MPAELYSSNSEFSPLWGGQARPPPCARENRLTSIAGAGVNINFPRSKISDYLGLLCREILLKSDYLCPRQSAHYLRLKGLPLLQLTSEELTELVFRLCSRFNILDGNQGERTLSLTPEQCKPDAMALYKGLGFNGLRLHIDASIASHDRSIDAIRKAVDNIRNYSGYQLGIDIIFGTDTSSVFLERLATYLIGSQACEIEFHWEGRDASQSYSSTAFRDLYLQMCTLMADANFVLFADRCFKCQDHPDIALRDSGRLAYGPWGFHSTACADWLSFGPGADGMIAGYLYHNAIDLNIYQQMVLANQPPVVGWSRHALAEEPVFALIQGFYCHHRVSRKLFSNCPSFLESLKTLGWLLANNDTCELTAAGKFNLERICNLYSRQETADEVDC